MSTSSETYERNVGVIASNKKQCLTALINAREGLTARECSAKTGLSHPQCWRRLADLKTEGKAFVSGVRYENDNPNSVYKLLRQQPLFPTKKLTLKEYLQKEFPEILFKYQVLYERQL